MSGDLQAAMARAQAAQARRLGYRDAATRYDPSDAEAPESETMLQFRLRRVGDVFEQRDYDQLASLMLGWMTEATYRIEALEAALVEEVAERRKADSTLDAHIWALPS